MNSKKNLTQLVKAHGTPFYLYSLKELERRSKELLGLSLPFGFTPRYAAKANMNPEIIVLFDKAGLCFDASSSYEAMELIEMGVEPAKINLSSQQPAHNLDKLLQAGIAFTATSLYQLKLFIASPFHLKKVGLRINPGAGAGYNKRLTTGGPNSSFGLWHEYLPGALALTSKAGVKINRLHIHYGSGSDPTVWGGVIESSLEIAEKIKDITILNIGGGFKVKRWSGEKEANMTEIAKISNTKLKDFAKKTGRQLQLEIEPGTWLVAQAGTLVAKVVDIVDTGASGHTFLRLNTGMNDLIRPTMYGAQHKIKIINNEAEQKNYIVVGHNCETGDVLTPAPGNPEELQDRYLSKASIGDVVAIYDTGAYGRYFSAHGYNSFPSAKEICL